MWSSAYDREEQELERQLEAGDITPEEFRRAIRDMNDELRGQAEEAAERAYQDVVGY